MADKHKFGCCGRYVADDHAPNCAQARQAEALEEIKNILDGLYDKV